jgi:hypothetical protein
MRSYHASEPKASIFMVDSGLPPERKKNDPSEFPPAGHFGSRL